MKLSSSTLTLQDIDDEDDAPAPKLPSQQAAPAPAPQPPQQQPQPPQQQLQQQQLQPGGADAPAAAPVSPRTSAARTAPLQQQERLQRPTTAALGLRRSQAQPEHYQPVKAQPQGEASSINVYLQALKHPTAGIRTHDVRHNFQYYRGVFSGLDAADWFMQNMEGVTTLPAAQSVGQKFVDLGVFANLNGSTNFECTDRELYQFQEYDSAAAG